MQFWLPCLLPALQKFVKVSGIVFNNWNVQKTDVQTDFILCLLIQTFITAIKCVNFQLNLLKPNSLSNFGL